LDDFSFEVELFVSELVINVVLYVGIVFEVVLICDDSEFLCIEVCDGSCCVFCCYWYFEEVLIGCGMLFVESLVLCYGVEVVFDGKLVWFELVVDVMFSVLLMDLEVVL